MLSDNQFKKYAFQFYDNPQCVSISQFEQDVKRFGFVNETLNKYLVTGNFNPRSLVNQFIVIHNLFGSFTICGILTKVDKKHIHRVKTILKFLNLIPINSQLNSVEDDLIFLQALQKL